MPLQSPEPFLASYEQLEERRLASLVRESWLVPPDRLPEAYAGLIGALESSGIPVPAHQPALHPQWSDFEHLCSGHEGQPGFAGLRRCDATIDVRPSTRSEGLALLAGVLGVSTTVPRAQVSAHYATDGTGAVETVYLRGYSGVKILGRWYDKGVESGLASRGQMIRAEDQRRFPKGHRRGVGEMNASYVRAKFQQRFYPLWQATKGVTVAGPLVLTDRIAQLVEEHEISFRQAEQLAAYVVLHKRVKPSRATTYRRRALLRKYGLVVADGALEEVEVDLHEVLEQALESEAWAAQG